MDSEAQPSEVTGGDRLLLDIDVRLHDVLLWALGEAQLDDALLAAFLRCAYGAGYYDALSEPVRGQLCRDHGFAVPQRPPQPN